MAVYVDNAKHPYRGMLMAHMWADSERELLVMVDKIRVERRHIQKPPKAAWLHFDICQSKRALAIQFGAVPTDRYGPLEHVAKKRGHKRTLERIAQLRSRDSENNGQLKLL